MNIVLAIQSLELGGAERQVIELAAGLKTLGHDVSICCLNILGPLAEEAVARGITVVCLHKKFKYDIRVVFWLEKYLKNQKADVLQTFLFGADLWGRIAGRLAQVKVLITSDRSGGRYYDWKEKWADKMLWRLADGLITNSHTGRERVASLAGVPSDRIHIVFNGVDPKRFQGLPESSDVRHEFGLHRDSFVIAITGSIIPVKNYKMFLEVAKKVRGLNGNVEFMVIGDGPSLPEIKELARKIGIAESVIFLGRRLDVPYLLKAADAGVLCSTWEGFPNAIMEYMASGLPVVATDVGGIRDLVKPNETGFIVANNDVEAMASKLLLLSKNTTLAESMGQAGKRWIEGNCDYTSVADKYEQIFKQCYLNNL